MSLDVVWFVIVAFFWTGFFVLEGFDFGVGMLHRIIGRTDDERAVVVESVGPLWDGNEVWLIVGGASIFAAFPAWYATWFSAGYLALMLLLVALIIRGVSFEWRTKVDADRWRGTWSWTLTIGSVLIPLVLGIAFGDLLAGLPIDDEGAVHRIVLGPVHAVRRLDGAHPRGPEPHPRVDVPRSPDARRTERACPRDRQPARLARRGRRRGVLGLDCCHLRRRRSGGLPPRPSRSSEHWPRPCCCALDTKAARSRGPPSRSEGRSPRCSPTSTPT